MQIIERNMFGVRTAIYEFAHPDHLLEFVVFPMIHIGEPEFYEEITSRLKECDLILFEGVQSSTVSFLTMGYRFASRRKRLGLVTQAAIPMQEMASKLAHADLKGQKFDSLWRKLPFFLRFVTPIAIPFYGLYCYLTASRQSIAKHLEINDLPSRDDLLDEDSELDEIVLGRRDQRLLASILLCHRKRKDEKIRVGILFGAAHMPPVYQLLQQRLGYKTKNQNG